MFIKYLGPSDSVNVGGYGSHAKAEVKEYPDEFGEELLATSKKQKFEVVKGAGAKAKVEAGDSKKASSGKGR